MALILNPEVKLREDQGRVILFSANAPDTIGDPVFRFLYPQQAIILSLLDGSRALPELKADTARIFRLPFEDAETVVNRLLSLPVSDSQKLEELLVDASTVPPASRRLYDPRQFIVRAEAIKMDDLRCSRPSSIIVLPTMRCVTNCVYCYANRRSLVSAKEFDLEFYRCLLEQAQSCDIETIEFSGGDFFCRRDAFDILEETFQAGLYPTIPTKYPLSNVEIDRLVSIGLRTIQLSIDARSPQLIDKLMHRQGYGMKILRTLEALGEAGIRVRTNSVLIPENLDEGPQLARFLASRPHVFMSNFTPYYRSMYNHTDELFCSTDSLARFEDAFETVRQEYPDKPMFFSGLPINPYSGSSQERRKRFQERAFCTANRRIAVVLPDGRVTACEEMYDHEGFIIGDLFEKSLIDIWNSPKARAIAYPDQRNVPDGACRDCAQYKECHERLGRCFREAMKAYGPNNAHWPDPRCPQAPIGNRLY